MLKYSIMPQRLMGEWRYSSTIIDLYAGRRQVGRFMPSPLYLQGKIPQCKLYRRLGEPPEPVWTLWRREKSHSFAWN
jgi:hypothetical protein